MQHSPQKMVAFTGGCKMLQAAGGAWEGMAATCTVTNIWGAWSLGWWHRVVDGYSATGADGKCAVGPKKVRRLECAGRTRPGQGCMMHGGGWHAWRVASHVWGAGGAANCSGEASWESFIGRRPAAGSAALCRRIRVAGCPLHFFLPAALPFAAGLAAARLVALLAAGFFAGEVCRGGRWGVAAGVGHGPIAGAGEDRGQPSGCWCAGPLTAAQTHHKTARRQSTPQPHRLGCCFLRRSGGLGLGGGSRFLRRGGHLGGGGLLGGQLRAGEGDVGGQ